MGGRALLALLPHATFPRLSPALYNAIRSHLHARLSPLFDSVATPHQAPEKLDHGDIDFIVASPQPGLKHYDVERALGATSQHSIPSPEVGAGTSHFALPLALLERELSFVEDGANHIMAHEDSSLATTADVDGRYVQVDVHLCPDVEDFERVVFFHGYGDLGMIMGALARSVGLQLGSKGLKISSPALAPTFSTSFQLSSTFPPILAFFGLSLTRWEEGFETQISAFEWIATSRFYDPRRIASRNSDKPSREKSLRDRKMYQAFWVWNESQARLQSSQSGFKSSTNDDGETVLQPEERSTSVVSVHEEALVYFGRKSEHDDLMERNQRRIRFKKAWNGTNVADWTGWYGSDVGRVMKLVREWVGGEEVMMSEKMGEERLKEMVLLAKVEVERRKTLGTEAILEERL